MVSRFEVRMNTECREKLDELAESRGVSAADIVRQLIDAAYEEVIRQRRLQAAEELIAMEVEDPPDPEELSRILDSAHDVCGLC